MTEETREPSKLLYRYLESVVEQGENFVRESSVETPDGFIRHAIDPAGNRMLMLPVSEGEFSTFVNDSAGRSVSLRKERWATDTGAVSPFVVFRCESRFLDNTFASFVDDVLDEFLAAGPGVSVPSMARAVLERWRRLFATHGPGLLTDKALVGLTAELRVLSALVLRSGPSALAWWTGPEAADHDFALPGVSIEVKGTMKKTGMEVEINGIGQLSPAIGSRLYLAASRVTITPNGVVTVPGLVEELLEAGVDREVLSQKLESVGYFHSRAEEYEPRRMDFVENRYFEITEGFPRIDRTTLQDVPQADRIRHVSYLLDLTSHETIDGALSAGDVETFLDGVL